MGRANYLNGTFALSGNQVTKRFSGEFHCGAYELSTGNNEYCRAEQVGKDLFEHQCQVAGIIIARDLYDKRTFFLYFFFFKQAGGMQTVTIWPVKISR